MPLPMITENMYFDTVLKAIETVLKAESLNQISLGGSGWTTVRERFDAWDVDVDGFKETGVVNVRYDASQFGGSQNNIEQKSDTQFVLDCYASARATESAGTITPKDQNSVDVLHTLITKVDYTIMSPINRDLGLTPGKIERAFITSIQKFIPTKQGAPVEGIIAARITCRIGHEEIPPEGTGVDLNVINVKTNRDDDVPLTEQQIDV